ncbi:amidohydrolase [Desulforhopalus singaporensis]|uniref:Amidohydrolase 3 domain-containing protein n=1 Tax=Desulforhopalus singaporensis TaxID=91360 RepID=A0A1H0NZ92_9BACT|nr:amidohydrolase [Desulforhopalus singaporensis]SDO97755.1 hypothetical protein SAMN05660330_01502 [Desulforhopalus singaporensis]
MKTDSKPTIFTAKKIITMNPVVPEAAAVAVRGDRILAVGAPDELKGWGEHVIDETFKDKILTPGFVEAHSHVLEGILWMFPYVGFFDRRDPDGRVWQGCRDLDALSRRLKELETELASADEPLVVWGVDPLYFAGDRLTATNLDVISTTRPIFVLHASGHLATVNTALMNQQGIDEKTDVVGVAKGADNKPTGELQELKAIMLAGDFLQQVIGSYRSPKAWHNFGRLANNVGCTTITDLGFLNLDDDAVELLRSVVDTPDYPVRVTVLYSLVGQSEADLDEVAEYVAAQAKRSSEKLHLGQVKLVLDGSIQGFTARLRPPGYYGRNDNGIWTSPPEKCFDTLLPFHKKGVTVHCHCNGDEAVDVFLNAVEQAQAEYYRPDIRHTVQHCQLATIDQYQRMAALGVCANIFTNHLFYWGDQHVAATVGPDRAMRMEACATAKLHNIHFSLHSDAPVTPLGQLHTAWCAVNRLTSSGRTLGEYEKISVYDALYAVTLDGAYTLGLDRELGSIEPGKLADFTVFEEDPLAVDPARLKDIGVWGTVLGGKVIPAAK